MTSAIPPQILNFVKIVNRGDVIGFLNLFAPNGCVDDWGRQFVGREAIKAWSDKEFLGAKGRMIVKQADQEGRSFTYEWRSTSYSGPGKITFEYEGDKLKCMHID